MRSATRGPVRRVGRLIDRWLIVLDVDPSTRRGYETKIRKHIRPSLGDVPLTRPDVETLDSFYAERRRCREHCDGRPLVQHRAKGTHLCDEHQAEPCTPPDPDKCRACRRACKLHVCKGLADSTVRQIHWIVSGALDHALVGKWISVNRPSTPTSHRCRSHPRLSPSRAAC